MYDLNTQQLGANKVLGIYLFKSAAALAKAMMGGNSKV